jgi:hypothetical protein
MLAEVTTWEKVTAVATAVGASRRSVLICERKRDLTRERGS